DRSLDADNSPKPTTFFPSIAETTLHNAGTYLCLLENFFRDVIKIDWKEKSGKTIPQSQQGNTMKTKDTFMKFSWLTVMGASMDKGYKCVIKHERNKGRVDQEILFSSQIKGMCMYVNLSNAQDVVVKMLLNQQFFFIFMLKSLLPGVFITRGGIDIQSR
uniref:Ig-like domain-containing protein n=1 Tax=Canis lupus dingo TaxID=286419 RepID=A0A8C0LK86_CANLU